MNWYHRLERRYVEYGSSLDASRSFGVFRALYDLVYNMNLAHLDPEVETLFERLGRRRGSHRLHAVSHLPGPPPAPGLPRRSAAPRRRCDPPQVPAPHLGPARAVLRRPLREPRGALQADLDPGQPRRLLGLLLGRAGERRRLRLPAFLAARQRQLLAPPRAEASVESISRADACFAELVEAAEGSTRFLDEHALILLADHAQTDVIEACRWPSSSPASGRSWRPPRIARTPPSSRSARPAAPRTSTCCRRREGRRRTPTSPAASPRPKASTSSAGWRGPTGAAAAP